MTPRPSPFALLTVLALCAPAPSAESQEMGFEEYDPPSTLKVPETLVTSARFPFVDIHNHLRGDLTPDRVDAIVAEMDALNMAVFVNLSGGTGARLRTTVEALKGRHPDRFVVFANPSFEDIDDPGYPQRAADRLEEDFRNGAQGLKIFKNLGMSVFDAAGNRVPVDDPRLDPMWAKAGELGIPVLIHTADPAPFWEPHDAENERWLELKQFPGRKRDGEPTWEQLIDEQTNVFRKHPETTFIAAHFMWMANDLERLGRVLDELPNVYTELGAIIYEPGRQPRFAARFFERYQDRILMGKDVWEPSEYSVYFRVLETDDEYFDYYRRRHAFWKMYGLDLPDDILRKVYYENARRIVPGLDPAVFPGN
ncbi:MAG: amidohydrolase family protein [Gemmatimonadota bacterium]|nr:amidohydrolase family protein [Gemmatimonadota bacterium]